MGVVVGCDVKHGVVELKRTARRLVRATDVMFEA